MTIEEKGIELYPNPKCIRQQSFVKAYFDCGMLWVNDRLPRTLGCPCGKGCKATCVEEIDKFNNWREEKDDRWRKWRR